MAEDKLQNAVQDLCTEYGLLWHHCNDSRKCAGLKGFPDLIIAGSGGLLFAELKSEDGDTTAQQDLWAWTLGCSGTLYVLWQPRHLADGTIRRVLQEIACES